MAALTPVPRPAFRLAYGQKDITSEVTPYVLSITYTDVLQGESDSIEVEIEDSDGRWLDGWYPGKGDTLRLSIGYEGAPLLDCGAFEIDEIEYSEPPSVARIRALSTPVNLPLRTRSSRAYEATTLAEIAGVVAQAHGFSIIGHIPDVPIERATQYSETDVGFLRRLAQDYGCAFKIVGKQLVFSQLSEMRKQAPVASFRRGDGALKSARLSDRISGGVYQSVKVRHHNPVTKSVIAYDLVDGKIVETPGKSHSDDRLHIARRANSPAHAQALANGGLEKNEDRGVSSATLIGDIRLVAGITVALEGFGKLSAAYLVHQSTHALSRSGYETSLELKRITP